MFTFVYFRSGVGAPVVNECEGEYHHDSRKSILEWSLPLIDESNSSGSMEFSINGHPDDFFPVNVTFVSKKSYCDIEVRICSLGKKFGTAHITFNLENFYCISSVYIEKLSIYPKLSDLFLNIIC